MELWLFKEALSISYYLASNDRMVSN